MMNNHSSMVHIYNTTTEMKLMITIIINQWNDEKTVMRQHIHEEEAKHTQTQTDNEEDRGQDDS